MICILDQNCLVHGQNGDGTTRGTCPQMKLCQKDGNCTEHCDVNGQPGTGDVRGSCKMDEVCWKTGACLPSKLSKIITLNCITC